MKRYGPLLAAPEALVVGDPGRHHLRLTPDAVMVRNGIDNRGMLVWEDIERITLEVPTTRFRLPGLVGTLLLGAVSASAMDDLGIEPDIGSVEVVISGEPAEYPLSRHHIGGYWAPTVIGAHRLLRHLIDSPEHRLLLTRPESLVDLAAKLARSRA